MDVGDTHKTLTLAVSAVSSCSIEEADGESGGGCVTSDNNKEDEDKRNCTSLPLCYDRVSKMFFVSTRH